MEEKLYRQGVIAIIISKENKILIVQLNSYKENEWNFPGGGRGKGESAEENLYREVEEEVGIARKDLEIIGMSANPLKYDFREPTIKDGILYHGQIKDQFIVRFLGKESEIKMQVEEIKNFKWVELKELKQYLVFDKQYENALDVIKEITKPDVRRLKEIIAESNTNLAYAESIGKSISLLLPFGRNFWLMTFYSHLHMAVIITCKLFDWRSNNNLKELLLIDQESLRKLKAIYDDNLKDMYADMEIQNKAFRGLWDFRNKNLAHIDYKPSDIKKCAQPIEYIKTLNKYAEDFLTKYSMSNYEEELSFNLVGCGSEIEQIQFLLEVFENYQSGKVRGINN